MLGDLLMARGSTRAKLVTYKVVIRKAHGGERGCPLLNSIDWLGLGPVVLPRVFAVVRIQRPVVSPRRRALLNHGDGGVTFLSLRVLL